MTRLAAPSWILAVVLLATGCIAAGGPRGPLISPTGVVYELGTPPVETRFSQTATMYLRQGRLDRAMDLLYEGLEANPGNPIHHFLAGSVLAMLGEYSEAHDYFMEAQRIYPAYELEIEPRRESAWAEAFNAGLEAYRDGDIEGTITAWEGAIQIFALRPDAHRNLLTVLLSEGRFPEAVRVARAALDGLTGEPAARILSPEEVEARRAAYFEVEALLAQAFMLSDRFDEAEPLLRRQLDRDPASVTVRSDLAIALSELGRDQEAGAIFAELLAEPDVESAVLFNLGVSAFRTGRYDRAAQVFGTLVSRQPHSRDAWFNYTNSLFAAEAWETIVEHGEEITQADPLSEAVGLIAARAHLELGDEASARRQLGVVTEAPVYVDGLQLATAAGRTVVRGRLVGNKADPGAPVRIRFAFLDDGREVGTEILSSATPPPGESASFEVAHSGRATAYRYELIR